MVSQHVCTLLKFPIKQVVLDEFQYMIEPRKHEDDDYHFKLVFPDTLQSLDFKSVLQARRRMGQDSDDKFNDQVQPHSLTACALHSPAEGVEVSRVRVCCDKQSEFVAINIICCSLSSRVTRLRRTTTRLSSTVENDIVAWSIYSL